MKKMVMTSLLIAGVVFSGCGSDDDSPKEILSDITTTNSVAFGSLQDHTIKVRELNNHTASVHTITFCKDDKVASGTNVNGIYNTNGANGIDMVFASGTEVLTENTTTPDAIFKHDEHVDFNGTASIITSIHWVPANSATCN